MISHRHSSQRTIHNSTTAATMATLQMDSIWLEDDNRDKLYNISLPNVEVLNSDTPILGSRNNVELPPLPPTSYFSTLMAHRAQEEENDERNKLSTKKSAAKLLHVFKKSFMNVDKENERDKQKLRSRISTPYGFSHISHVGKDSAITNKTFEIPVASTHSKADPSPSPGVTDDTSAAHKAVSCNRTAPSRNVSTSSSSGPSLTTIPRSASQSTSLFSTTRHASISTTATSTRAISRRNTHSHHHTTSASSIEQLTRFEKYQISKQCNPEYTSQRSSDPDQSSTTPCIKQHDDTLLWDTPSPGNVVRQSWIYSSSDTPELSSPAKFYLHSHSNTDLTVPLTENAIRQSLLLQLQTPLREQIDTFSHTMDASFDEGPEFQQALQQWHMKSDEALVSRAAEVSRMSRDIGGEMSDLGKRLRILSTLDVESGDEEYVDEQEDEQDERDDETEVGSDKIDSHVDDETVSML